MAAGSLGGFGKGDADEGSDQGADETIVGHHRLAEHVRVYGAFEGAEQDVGDGEAISGVAPALEQARDALDQRPFGRARDGIEVGIGMATLGEDGVQPRVLAVVVHDQLDDGAHALSHGVDPVGCGGLVLCTEELERTLGHPGEPVPCELLQERILVGEVLIEAAGRHAGSLGDALGGGSGVAARGELPRSCLDEGFSRQHRPALHGRPFTGVCLRHGATLPLYESDVKFSFCFSEKMSRISTLRPPRLVLRSAGPGGRLRALGAGQAWRRTRGDEEPNMQTIRRTILVLTASGTLGLGVGLGAGGCRAVHGVTHAASYALLPPEEENRLGEQVAAEFEREVVLLDDPEINAYVDELGERIVAVADVPDGIELSFDVIDAPDVINAVALPGGRIYVYTGLMRAAQDEAELVAVLAHEVAHVTRRHIASQLVAMFGVQTLAGMVLGENPGMVQQLAAGVAAQGYMLQFGREAEREADEVGLQYVVEAGWDPHGYVSFFNRLVDQGQCQRHVAFGQCLADPHIQKGIEAQCTRGC